MEFEHGEIQLAEGQMTQFLADPGTVPGLSDAAPSI
jgi:hypothetical protein